MDWKQKLGISGQAGYRESNDTIIESEITGKQIGELKKFNELAFLKVFEAGHMVPYDQVQLIEE